MSLSQTAPDITVIPADRRMLWLLLSGLAIVGLSLLALRFGLRTMGWSDIIAALRSYDATNPDHITLLEIRLPRLIGALIAGAALGASGALIQGLTRNPLADPGLLGLNGGAALGVVLCIFALGITDPAQFIWAAMLGAVSAAGLVLTLGGGTKGTTVRLILAGAAASALFMALTRGLLMISQQALEVYRYWVLGGFNGIDVATVQTLLPFFAVGALLAAIAAPGLNALLLGEDTARSLGLRVGLIRILAIPATLCLCAATVAMAGPIAFVGLIVPHLARAISGPDMRWVLLFSTTIGAALMISADLLGRLPLLGSNMQAGVLAAMIGGPTLIALILFNRSTPLQRGAR
ncbi:iron ABC transporter permease [Phaeobacter sp.]|uniref:FecCD family ABC transporter permease n=1 Tax=Phaeobacter sp. TaxID=1902409 RepID=UPI0025EBCFA4|nr:iron ABC transporter permease [Phaeobacter sp.]